MVARAERFSQSINRRVDARANGLAKVLTHWLNRLAVVELREALQDPWAYAGLRKAPVAKAARPPPKSEADDVARLLRMYGLEQAATAGKSVAGRPVVPETLIRQATAGRASGIVWVDELVRGAPERAKLIRESTKDAARASVRRILTEALDDEVQPAPGEIARRIRTAFQGRDVEREHRVHATEGERDFVFSSERAIVIARTELAQAENTGVFEGYRQTGVEVIEWSAYKDGRSGARHHERMDGVRVRVGEPFTLPSGSRLRYPCDPSAPIGETIQCRCVAIAVVDAA